MGGERQTMIIYLDEDKLARMIDKERERAVERASEKTEQRVKDNIISSGRVDTGKMHDTIRSAPASRFVTNVLSDLHYTIYQEKGIGPVTPVKAKALRFKPKGSGSFVFAMRTKGFPGAFFFQRAFNSILLQDFLA